MHISRYLFIVLILILHVPWYDTRQENYYFIRKLENESKIKMLSRWSIEPMPTDTENQRVSGVKKTPYHLNFSTTVLHSKYRVIKGMWFNTVKSSILRIRLLDLLILQKYAFLKQNKFIRVSLISF